MAKHDAKGRSKGGPGYLQLHRWMLDSAAWASLSVYSRCLYVELKRRFYGNNNGGISMSHREAQTLLGCSNRPVMAAFAELQAKGFIKAEQKGAFKGVPMATTWTLTELPQDVPVKTLSATKDFMQWKPVENLPNGKKTRCAESIPTVCAKHTVNDESVCAEHTVSVPKAYGKGHEQPSPSVLRAYTYSSTTSPSPQAASARPPKGQARDAAKTEPEPLGNAIGGVLVRLNPTTKRKEPDDASECAREIQSATA